MANQRPARGLVKQNANDFQPLHKQQKQKMGEPPIVFFHVCYLLLKLPDPHSLEV
jgi:hypothetical protein